jgi:hypothetical protein
LKEVGRAEKFSADKQVELRLFRVSYWAALGCLIKKLFFYSKGYIATHGDGVYLDLACS